MITLHDILEAKKEFLELGYVTDLVIIMNYNTFEMLTLPPTKTLGKTAKTLFGMEIKFNKLVEDDVFYIQEKQYYDLNNKLAKITIDE